MNERINLGQPGLRMAAGDLQVGDVTDLGTVKSIDYVTWTRCYVVFEYEGHNDLGMGAQTTDLVTAFSLGLPRLTQATKVQNQKDQETAPAKTLEEARYA